MKGTISFSKISVVQMDAIKYTGQGHINGHFKETMNFPCYFQKLSFLLDEKSP